MNRYLLAVLLVLTFAESRAQSDPSNTADTMYHMQLPEVNVRARWINDTDRYHYNQKKYYVKTILPYLNAATVLFKEVNAKIDDGHTTKRERKKFVNQKEDELRTKFEDKISELNVTQGVLLVKLIARQTEVNIYKILKEFKNPLTAMKWQAWARLHGMNLDKMYDPEQDPDLENIMEELGYPLPAGYAVNKN